MIQTGNQTLVKQINKSIVLDMIKNKDPLSRADIAQLTKLNKGTVSSLVSELIDEHLVIEVGPGESSGGRRPVLLHFNQNAGYIIGIDIGVNYILCILTDLRGNIIEKSYKELQKTNYDYVLSKIYESVDNLLNLVPPSPYNLVGIGVGVPGIINHNGEVLFAPNLEWHNKNVKSDLEDYFNLPVHVENEANCGAYGEKLYGCNTEITDLIYISAGIGIGCGIIINGSLYRGADGFSGELGHMVIERNGQLCRCGNQGCWEMYASESSLIREAMKRGFIQEADASETDFLGQLIEDANNGHEETIKLFKKLGENIGIGINNIVNTFNPGKVIIGNRLSMAENWLIESMTDKISQQRLSFQQRDVQVVFSKLSTLSCSLGVSAFVVEDFLDRMSK